MPESVEKVSWMFELACKIAPARKVRVPMLSNPWTVRQITNAYAE